MLFKDLIKHLKCKNGSYQFNFGFHLMLLWSLESKLDPLVPSCVFFLAPMSTHLMNVPELNQLLGNSFIIAGCCESSFGFLFVCLFICFVLFFVFVFYCLLIDTYFENIVKIIIVKKNLMAEFLK